MSRNTLVMHMYVDAVHMIGLSHLFIVSFFLGLRYPENSCKSI